MNHSPGGVFLLSVSCLLAACFSTRGVPAQEDIEARVQKAVEQYREKVDQLEKLMKTTLAETRQQATDAHAQLEVQRNEAEAVQRQLRDRVAERDARIRDLEASLTRSDQQNQRARDDLARQRKLQADTEERMAQMSKEIEAAHRAREALARDLTRTTELASRLEKDLAEARLSRSVANESSLEKRLIEAKHETRARDDPELEQRLARLEEMANHQEREIRRMAREVRLLLRRLEEDKEGVHDATALSHERRQLMDRVQQLRERRRQQL